MAGDIKSKYGSSSSFTVTSLQSLSTSSDWTAGWTSAAVDSAGDGNPIDYQISCTFTSASANRQAGNIRIYAYAALNDTPTWPDIFSSGTEGSEGAATAHGEAARNAGMRLVDDPLTNATNAAVFTFTSFLSFAFQGAIVPQDWALFIAHNITSSGAGFASSGNAVYRTPVFMQYT